MKTRYQVSLKERKYIKSPVEICRAVKPSKQSNVKLLNLRISCEFDVFGSCFACYFLQLFKFYLTAYTYH
jgi:hypothetical protein